MAYRGYIGTYLDGSLVMDDHRNVLLFKSKDEIAELEREQKICIGVVPVVDVYRRRGPKRGKL